MAGYTAVYVVCNYTHFVEALVSKSQFTNLVYSLLLIDIILVVASYTAVYVVCNYTHFVEALVSKSQQFCPEVGPAV